MPDDPIAALITDGPASPFVNRHENISQPFQRHFLVANPADGDFSAGLKMSASAVQRLIASAITDGVSLRAVGGGWSLSSAAATEGRMLGTLGLDWSFPIDGAAVVAGFRGDASLLQYFQCGFTIERINATLLARNLALKTSGASNGQTIAGAISTGTHGSRFAFGAMQEYVRGLHIITGPDRVIWLERASDPVLSDASVAMLGAQLIRDDTLFNSALVSFGSFGVIFGVLIEAEPIYLLELHRGRLPVDDNLKRAMRTLDLSGIPTPSPEEPPLHFEVVINPHDVAGGAYVTTMYRRKYPDEGDPDYKHPFIEPGGLGPGDDVVAFIGKVGDLLGTMFVGLAVNQVVKLEYPLYDNNKTIQGTPGEIFCTNTLAAKDLCSEIGVALEDSARAYETLVSLPQVKDYPGLLAFRWVKGSQAVLAFTKFPTTCTIELPAAFSDSTMAYYNAAWKALDDAGIPCTFHWGQLGDFTPDRVRRMYGAACDTWMSSRSQLLSPQARAVFSNAFLRQCGLG